MTPKTKEQYQSIREQSATTIKEVALDLFAHNGYAHTSVAMIAKKAGVSKGLMYNYFESKLDLLRAIVVDAIQIGEELMAEGIHASPDANGQLKALIQITFKTVKNNPEYWKLITFLAFQQDVFDGIKDLVGDKNMENILAVVPLLEEIGFEEPEKEALAMGAMLDGIMMAHLSIGDDYPLDDMEAYMIKKYTTINDSKSQ